MENPANDALVRPSGETTLNTNSTNRASRRWPSLRSNLAKLILFALASRLLLLILAYVSLAVTANQNILGLGFDTHYASQLKIPFGYADVSWYRDIALNGYEQRPFSAEGHANWVFFPLWPLILRLCNFLFSDMILPGMIISNILFLLALIYLYELIALDFDENIAMNTAVLTIIFPAAYYFLRPGPESFFLFSVAGSLFHARKEQWIIAGILGALATLSRSQGVLLLLPLLFIYYQQYKRSNRHDKKALGLLLIPLSLISFMVHLYLLTGNPLASFEIQKPTGWDNNLSFPLAAMLRYIVEPKLISHYGWDLSPVSFIFLSGALVLTVLMVRDRRIPREYLIYTLLSLYLIIARDNMSGSLRYILPVFPLYLTLVLLMKTRKVIFDFVLFSFSSLQMFYFLAFIHLYHWAAT